jgi:hypothetical protein
MLFCWRYDHGVIYMSGPQFRRIQTDPLGQAFVKMVAQRIEVEHWAGCYSEFQGVPDTNECVNAMAVAHWLDLAAKHEQMREDAYIVFSLIAMVDPDVELPFAQWAEQLPVAI